MYSLDVVEFLQEIIDVSVPVADTLIDVMIKQRGNRKAFQDMYFLYIHKARLQRPTMTPAVQPASGHSSLVSPMRRLVRHRRSPRIAVPRIVHL